MRISSAFIARDVVANKSISSHTNDWATNLLISRDGTIHLTGNTGWSSNLGGNSAIGYHEGFWATLDTSLNILNIDFIGTPYNDGIRSIEEISEGFVFVVNLSMTSLALEPFISLMVPY